MNMASKKAASTKNGQLSGREASAFIDRHVQDLGDWRGATLAKMRAWIREADPAIVEEVKWMGVPVWSHDGIVCTGETYKKAVKLTFAHGAKVADPSRLFNSSLEGNTRRAIDIAEGATVDASAFKALVKAAVALNASKKPPKAKAVAEAGQRQRQRQRRRERS